MANLIQIKRSESTQTPASLANGELAWSSNGDKLFIGDFNTVTAIGGNYITNNDGNIEVSYDTSGVTLELANSVNITSLTLSGDEVTAISSNLNADSSTTSLVTADAVVDYVNEVSGSSTLAGLTDTNITSPADGALLFYDTGTSKWIDNVISGDATIADTGVLTLATVNDDAGVFGDANTVGSFTIDAKGRVTNASSVDIDHDALLNFVSNEHIDHSSVNITAGSGLTGGGDITATRTLNVGAGDGITVAADSVAVKANNGITVTADGVFVDGANGISVDATGVNVQGANGIIVDTSGVNVQAANSTLSVTTSGVAVVESELSLTASQISDLGTNAVTSLTGTANEVEVDTSTGAVTVGLPNSVVVSQNLTVGNDLTVSGDLIVNGNTTTINVTELKVEDGLIHLGSNNVADSIDLGFVVHYSDDAGSTIEHAGLFRDATDEKFYLFKNLVDANLDNGATTVNRADGTYADAALVVGDLEANTLTLSSALTVANGGTGATSFTDNGVIYGNGTGALSVTAAGTEGQVLQADASGVPVFGTLDGGTF